MRNFIVNFYKKNLSSWTNTNDIVPLKMRAILQNSPGDVNTIYIGETEIPVFVSTSFVPITLMFPQIGHCKSYNSPGTPIG